MSDTTSARPAPPVVPVVSLLARWGLAAVWLISGYPKFVDPVQTEIAVGAYRLLPDGLVEPMAIALPLAELTLGALLLLGLATRWVSVVSALLLVVLIAVIASVWARGLTIDCGCFGAGGENPDANAWTYLVEILRDLGFLALALWLTFRPRTWAALGPGSRL